MNILILSSNFIKMKYNDIRKNRLKKGGEEKKNYKLIMFL